MTPSVVVTGASGFLGRVVVQALRERGARVIPVARRPLAGSVQVRSYDEAPEADILIHLAADSDRARAVAARDGHVQETVETLQGLLAKPYRLVLYASSAVLYGDQSEAPHAPDDPIFDGDAYSRAKKEGERLVIDSGKGIAVRLSNLYGPGMSGGNVLSTILRQVCEKTDNPLTLWDDSPIRDFLWVEDAAVGFALMALQTVAKDKGRTIYNLGSGTGTSIGDLARLALALAGHPARQVEATKPSGHRSNLVLDIAATTEAFGWRPKTDLKKGLAALISSFVGA